MTKRSEDTPALEEWRPVAGSPGYEVSDKGRVRSPDVRIPNTLTGGFSERKGRILAGTVNKATGYRMVYLGGENPKKVSVHRLVAIAFHGRPPFKRAVVRHLDGDPLNNSKDNLKWGTYRENEQDKIRHGRNPEVNKTHCPKGHEYTEENTRRNKNGHRFCRECSRLYSEGRKRRGLPEGDDRHGSENGYVTYGCRCPECKTAYSRARKVRLELNKSLRLDNEAQAA